MNFLSLKFLLFFGLVYLIYWNFGDKLKRPFILIVSAYFYSTYSFNFLLHLIFVISVNFFIIKYFFEKKYFLKLSVFFNLLNLVLFKYFYFLMELFGGLTGLKFLTQKTELNQMLSSLTTINGFEIALPVFISYYTFQFISLSVDLKNKVLEEKPTYYDVSSFILFFPVMVAGPILRFKQFVPQLKSPKMDEDLMYNGLYLILLGLFKKAVLSTLLVPVIYPVLSKPADYASYTLLLCSFSFAINLYLDFSGLTDLARGMGKLLGLELPENFKAPFYIDSFGELWRRWHLTFSYWIRDYIYIPLGGSRASNWRVSLNLIITFTLGGLWHGASLNFALWGFITGIYLSLERVYSGLGIRIIPKIPILNPILNWLLIITIYIFSWIFFFTPDFSTAISVIQNILIFKSGKGLNEYEMIVYIFVFTAIFHYFQEKPEKFTNLTKAKKYLFPVFSLIMILLLINYGGGNFDFFYSQF
ncbi:MAG: MBOAT family protein [Leptospiraceae bacterium]|nr:MBOAT family protein [Leptospiraceae bacterium]MCP5497149.1 MBOAT family protein [Leptospiraceae bacterium]